VKPKDTVFAAAVEIKIFGNASFALSLDNKN
jgi:hypothetical protein